MFIYIWHQLSVLLLEGVATFIVVVICKGKQPLPIFWRSMSESVLNAADGLDNSAPLAVLFAADLQQAIQYRTFWLFNLLLAGPLLLHLRHTLPALLARATPSTPSPPPHTDASAPSSSAPLAAPASSPEPSRSTSASSDAPSPDTSTSTSATSSQEDPPSAPPMWSRSWDAARAAASMAATASTSAAAAVVERLPPPVQGPVSAALRLLAGLLTGAVRLLLATGLGSVRLAVKALGAPIGSQPRPTTSLALTVASLATLAACLVTPFVEPLPDAQDPRGVSGMLFSLAKCASLVLELAALRLAAGLCWATARHGATAALLLASARKAAWLVLWRAAVESAWAVGIAAQVLCGITSGWKLAAAACGAYLAWRVLRDGSSPTGVQALLASRGTLAALALAALVTSYPVCLPPVDLLPDLPIITQGSSPIWTGIAA